MVRPPHALVTGSTGFIGTSLVGQLLSAGWEVTTLKRQHALRQAAQSRPEEQARELVFEHTSQVAELVRLAAPDRIYHLAGFVPADGTASDVQKAVDANITLGAHLLAGVDGTKAVAVCALSYFQYLNGMPRTRSLYTATKQAFFDIAEHYRLQRSVDVRHVVLYDNYGPADVRRKLLNELLRDHKSGTATTIGPRDQRTNMLHVDDVAAGFIAAGDQGNPPMMTVRSPQSVTIGEVIDTLESAFGRRFETTVDSSRTAITYADDAGDWPTPLDWSPTITLEEGFSQLATDSARS